MNSGSVAWSRPRLRFVLCCFVLFFFCACSKGIGDTEEIAVRLVLLDDACLENRIVEFKKQDSKNPGQGKSVQFVNLSLEIDKECKREGCAILENAGNYFYVIPTKLGTSLEVVHSRMTHEDNKVHTSLKTEGGELILDVRNLEGVNTELMTGNAILEPLEKSLIYLDDLGRGGENEGFLPQYDIYILEGSVSIRSPFHDERVICSNKEYARIRSSRSIELSSQLSSLKQRRMRELYARLKDKGKERQESRRGLAP